MVERVRLLHFAAWVVPAVMVLALGGRIAAPLPIPAATVTLGGLVGLALRHRWATASILIGGLVGLVVGVAAHLGSHSVEGRMDYEDGLAYHMLENTAVGVLIAAVALGLGGVARRVVRRAERPGACEVDQV